MKPRELDPVCPQCGNTADDGLNSDTGLCDYCMESPRQRAARRRSEAMDAFESGRHVEGSDDSIMPY
jgi:hypothetical protein